MELTAQWILHKESFLLVHNFATNPTEKLLCINHMCSCVCVIPFLICDSRGQCKGCVQVRQPAGITIYLLLLLIRVVFLCLLYSFLILQSQHVFVCNCQIFEWLIEDLTNFLFCARVELCQNEQLYMSSVCAKRTAVH